MITFAWIAFLATTICIFYIEARAEQKRRKEKYGMTRSEFKAYKKAMNDSAIKLSQKKSPAKAEPLFPMFRYN